jgi:hypothetical protein
VRRWAYSLHTAADEGRGGGNDGSRHGGAGIVLAGVAGDAAAAGEAQGRERQDRTAAASPVSMGAAAEVLGAAPTTPQSESRGDIRPTESLGSLLLAEGAAQSATFRRLIQQVLQSDLIVYVDVRPELKGGARAKTRFLGASATQRFVSITLDGRNGRATLIALLGHELQHAVEIAAAPHVRSRDAMERHYELTGVRMGRQRYESHEAMAVERAVRRELFERRGGAHGSEPTGPDVERVAGPGGPQQRIAERTHPKP